jgi:hypothetical protein
MRALFIVLAAEAIKARLLGLLVVLWWPGGFGLEGAVHALGSARTGSGLAITHQA